MSTTLADILLNKTQLEQLRGEMGEVAAMVSEITKRLNANITAHSKTSKSIKSSSGSMKGFLGAAGAFVSAIVTAGVMLDKFTKELVRSNQEFLDLTRTSDIALGTFQKWDSVGKMLGVEGAASQLEGLNQRLYELRLTGRGAEGFMLAGINPAGDANAVMEQIRERIKGMDDTSATYILKQMGIDPKMLHMLRMSREEFENLNAEMSKYRLTDEQTEQIQQMNVKLQIAGQKMKYLKDKAILGLMPYTVKLAQSFARIAEALLKVGTGAVKLAKKFKGVIAALVYLFSHLTLLKRRFQFLQPVLKILQKTRIMFKQIGGTLTKFITKLPLIGRYLGWIGKLFTRWLFPLMAIYLLIDDIATYLNGGDSVIGDVIDWFKNGAGEFGEAFKTLFTTGDFKPLLDAIKKAVLDIVDAITLMVDVILGTNFSKKNPSLKEQYEAGAAVDLETRNTKKIDTDKLPEAKSQKQKDAQEALKKAQNATRWCFNEQQRANVTQQIIDKHNAQHNDNRQDNRKVSMNISINTPQAADAVLNQLDLAKRIMV